MSNNEQLKYLKKFADAVLDGSKEYEIRKASKGYTSGYKELVSIDSKKIDIGPEIFDSIDVPKEIYGKAYYSLIGANNEIIMNQMGKFEGYCMLDLGYKIAKIDYETAKFAKENYIDNDIDYVIFKITKPRKAGKKWDEKTLREKTFLMQ